MRDVIIVTADFFPAEEPIRIDKGKAFQQGLHVHLREPSHHSRSLHKGRRVTIAVAGFHDT
jgi:hypothetical protein